MSKISIYVTFLLAVSAYCHDLILGYPDLTSKAIYSEVHQENPALWVRSETFTVNCSRHEVVNAIKIVDLRKDKWGEAYVKGGGIGQSYVTIELDSPSVFRGFNFFVEVYAIETGYFMYSHGK